MLKKATVRAKQGDVSAGYEDLHIAEREAVPGMTDEERMVRAQSLRVEVHKKLTGEWRGTAIQDLLGNENTTPVSAAALADAINHRNTHDRNMHRKMDKVRWQLAWLGFFIGGLVAVAFVVGLRMTDLPTVDLSLLPYCIYLGLLGGLMSSAMSAKGTDRRARVPEIGVEFYARVARSLLGAAASIPVYIAGVEGIVTIGGSEHSKSWGLLLLCFISGFSERWFRSTVAAVSGEEAKKPAESDKDQK
jgi:hypothetical protein